MENILKLFNLESGYEKELVAYQDHVGYFFLGYRLLCKVDETCPILKYKQVLTLKQ